MELLNNNIMKNQNILYVHNVAKIGGAERVTLDIIKGLPKNINAFLVAPENGPLLDKGNEIGANTKFLKIIQPDFKRLFSTLANHLTWYKYLKKNQITLIHAGDLFVIRTLIVAAKKLKIPIIAHVHFPIELPALKWIFSKHPYKIQFIYCSQELCEAVKPRVNSVLPKCSHFTIHNGVDIELYKKFHTKNNILPLDQINIGIVANLQERKGHLDYINAASLVVKQYPNVLFHIIGGDVFGESRELVLKRRVDELGLNNFIIFHGQISNVQQYLNELSIYVCASHEEAFPISILEAMAFGLPIVSTNVNGIPEAIEDGINGLLCEPQNPQAIAANIIKILRNEIDSSKLSKESVIRAKKLYSLEVFNIKIAKAYQEIQ